MASQRWIVLFALLALFIFMVEARIQIPSACQMDVFEEIKESINDIEGCNCSGKLPNCPLKVKRRSHEKGFYNEIVHRPQLFKGWITLSTG